MKKTENFPGLQAARFYAASSIVAFHLVPLTGISIPRYFVPVQAAFGFGLPFFYVLSAFALMVGYHGRLNDLSSIRGYFSRRFYRIAPLFYVMILVTGGVSAIAGGTLPGPLEVLSSMLFVFNWIPQYAEGYVAASWSIGVEMTFYALLPLLLIVAVDIWTTVVLVVAAGIIASLWLAAFQGSSPVLATFSGSSFISLSYFFFLGMLGFYVFRRMPRSRVAGTVALVIGAVLLCVLTVGSLNFVMYLSGPIIGWEFGPVEMRLLWGVALTFLVVGLAISPFPALVNSVSMTLGAASFSIYLWHPIVIGLLARFGAYRAIEGAIPDPMTHYVAAFALSIAVIFPLSLLSYRFIEQPGQRLGRRSRVLEKAAGAPAE